MNNIAVFVYGSLKNGYQLHNVMKSAEFVGEGKVRDFALFTHKDTPFPFMAPYFDFDVHGEIYFVSEELLGVLDDIESEGELYHRIPVDVIIPNSHKSVAETPKTAYTYMVGHYFIEDNDMKLLTHNREHRW